MATVVHPGPEPETVRSWRDYFGMSRAEAAALVYVSESAWCLWETPRDRARARAMPRAVFELYCIKAAEIYRIKAAQARNAKKGGKP